MDVSPDPVTEAVLLLIRRADDGPEAPAIGAASIGPVDPATHAAQLTVLIEPGHQRRGFATEATAHLLSALLDPDGAWRLRRVWGTAPGSADGASGLARRLKVKREVRSRQDRWTDRVGLDDTLGWGVLAEEWDAEEHRVRGRTEDHDIGVGPHPRPWPTDDRYDPALLEGGDRRNVIDAYRYWTMDAIRADLAARSKPFHVAIENWRHDMNIGTVVRCANAFGARAVHVVGRKHWNRRGAMVTDRYLDVRHHDTIDGFVAWASDEGLPIIGIDNLPGSVDLMTSPLPEACVMLFGQEGPGLSDAAREAVATTLHIPQSGSTRSINAGVASGIAMAEWVRQHG